MPTASRSRRASTPYHEAGHAVLAIYVGTGLQSVTILSDDESSGTTIDGGEESEEAQKMQEKGDEVILLRIAMEGGRR
jgi:ATP-dependent Zn protease